MRAELLDAAGEVIDRFLDPFESMDDVSLELDGSKIWSLVFDKRIDVFEGPLVVSLEHQEFSPEQEGVSVQGVHGKCRVEFADRTGGVIDLLSNTGRDEVKLLRLWALGCLIDGLLGFEGKSHRVLKMGQEPIPVGTGIWEFDQRLANARCFFKHPIALEEPRIAE